MHRRLAALLCLALAACGGPRVEVPGDAVIRLSEQFTGDFDLVNVQGERVTDETFRGKVTAVYFGFATCPDVCPMALGSLSAALNELSERERADIAPVFITVDPERDTPAALATFLGFDERLIGLTGSPAAVRAAQESFKVFARRQPLPDSALGYTMDHSSLFYIVDRDGQPQYALQDTLTPAQLAEMLRRSI